MCGISFALPVGTTERAFIVSGLLMVVLGLLGFFGAKKTAPKAMLLQFVGSLVVVMLVFGGINQARAIRCRSTSLHTKLINLACKIQVLHLLIAQFILRV